MESQRQTRGVGVEHRFQAGLKVRGQILNANDNRACNREIRIIRKLQTQQTNSIQAAFSQFVFSVDRSGLNPKQRLTEFDWFGIRNQHFSHCSCNVRGDLIINLHCFNQTDDGVCLDGRTQFHKRRIVW
jgi:hypothetical protein